jgi:pentatricopeptide repeat protein
MKCPKCDLENTADSEFCRKCGTRFNGVDQASFTKTLETTTDELVRGTLFAGRYEIIEELGAGGMGRVYRAHDTKLNEEVALKLIRPEIGLDKRTIERFQNEIKLTRKITHKNVCRMYDFHEEGKTLYLTMEYVRGEDLKSFIKRSKVLSTGTALSITQQVAEGLGEAHKLGVIHRDLKPGNIMIDKEGQAKIMDFGIARAIREKGITMAGALVGTPEYMSPEQVEGKEADPRSDIYALGVILFEMVTGQVPFEGKTAFSIAAKHKTEPPPIPKKLAPQIPEGLSKLILRCLEKDKAKRYQTAEELISDLSLVEDALPTAERVVPKRKTATHREITVKFELRRFVIPVAAVLILGVGGFLLWRNVINRPLPPLPSAKPTIAVLYLKNNSGDPTLDIWKENLPTLLAAGLNQSRYLRVLDDPTVYGILTKLNLVSSGKYTADELKRIAAEGGATHLLSGNYFTASGKFIVNLSLIDAKTGNVVKPIQEEAPNKDAVYNSVDVLVKKIKLALNIPEQLIDEDIYKMMGDVSSKNPQALQKYVEAVRFSQNYEDDKATKALERAVELDPEFAMAYVMLGRICGGQGDYFKEFQCLTKAYELRDKLPEKDRLIVEGSLYMAKEKTIPKAIDLLRKAVERYPEDFQARADLASLGWVDIDLRIKELENLIYEQNQTKAIATYTSLAEYYCHKGEYSRARECYETMVNANPPDATRQAYLGDFFMLEKNYDAALREFRKAVALAPDDPLIKINSAFYYYLFRGELKKYRETIEGLRRVSKDPSSLDGPFEAVDLVEGKFREVFKLIEEAEKKEQSVESLPFGMQDVFQGRGLYYLQTGHPMKALEEFRKAGEIIKKEEDRVQDAGFYVLAHHRRNCMIFQICALCDTGNISEAEALLREFEGLVPDYMKKIMKKCPCYNMEFVEGKIALSNKNIPEAIRKLEIGWQELYDEDTEECNHAFKLDALADAYQLGGRLDKAAETYGRIQELLTGRAGWGAIYTRSYYKLGQVFEQMGKKAEAREKYGKFLDLWKDADPGLPEVADAKRRLAAL